MKIVSGAYYFKIFSEDLEKFSNSNEFNFQIHFEPEDRLLGLYVFSKGRGWYLASEDIYEPKDSKDLIVKMFNQRKKMMEEIYASR